MLHQAVNWHEGLFLQPHHFQAWDRHWNERIAAGERIQNPHGYGITKISVNSDALEAGYFQLDSLHCRTPGGVLVEIAEGQQSQRKDLRSEFDTQASSLNDVDKPITIFVAVPRLRLGGKNVADQQETFGARWNSELAEVADETDANNVQPVEFRRINAQILTSSEDQAGYDALPIARVVRGQGGSIKLAADYIPPLLDSSAWTGFTSHVLSSACDLMLKASQRIGGQLVQAGEEMQIRSSLDLKQILLMQVVNPGAAFFHMLRTSRGIHPQQVYFELARVLGSLDVLSAPYAVQVVKPYDHENLGPLFSELLVRLQNGLKSLEYRPFSQQRFVGSVLGSGGGSTRPKGMCLKLDPNDVRATKEWYLGVEQDQLPSDVIKKMLVEGGLDWKIGSADKVNGLFERRATGVQIEHISDPPEVLGKRQGWTLFKLTQGGEAWQDVLRSQTISLRFRDAHVANVESLQGSKELIVDLGKTVIGLRFSLFGLY